MKRNIFLFLIGVTFLCSCNQTEKKSQNYQNQIGDTPFDVNLDDANFQLCDASNTLHKRAYVKYDGGYKAIQKELNENYKFQTKYNSFNGYFIIRFVINCKDEAGRFRMEVLDGTFNLANPSKELQIHILDIFKDLKKWKHPFYEGKDYDGYKFITLKIVNGQIQLV
ncbi:hypothetical protein [Lacinutrix jangbogonensis]|uniref:hypothetical protein n=1 Tax=Lacinutrix jangbogonensis TaxID=1469557 RepID=UPI00053DD535|nr:hypothetical protein [Lacinutrix jangbogonensis]